MQIINMSKKTTPDIELKELSSSYPSLQDECDVQEEQKSVRVSRPQPRHLPIPPPASGPSSQSTPIVPITSTPPGPSFAEQQRLRNTAPQQAPLAAAEPPLSNPRLSAPPASGANITPGFRVVNCSGCRGAIQYPASVLIVCCTACNATTATRPLINIVCYYCRNSAYYPADQQTAICRCGTQYAIRPAY